MSPLPNNLLASGSTDGKIEIWNQYHESIKTIIFYKRFGKISGIITKTIQDYPTKLIINNNKLVSLTAMGDIMFFDENYDNEKIIRVGETLTEGVFIKNKIAVATRNNVLIINVDQKQEGVNEAAISRKLLHPCVRNIYVAHNGFLITVCPFHIRIWDRDFSYVDNIRIESSCVKIWGDVLILAHGQKIHFYR